MAAVGATVLVATLVTLGAATDPVHAAEVRGAAGVFSPAPPTCTFATVGADTFTVPAGVNAVSFEVFGANGGSAAGFVGTAPPNGGAPGGLGGKTSATLAVSQGDVFQLTVGAAGINGSSRKGVPAQPGGSGHGAGGFGGHGGGGSGGAGSDVRGDAFGPEDRLLVAGGGGGGGGYCRPRATSCPREAPRGDVEQSRTLPRLIAWMSWSAPLAGDRCPTLARWSRGPRVPRHTEGHDPLWCRRGRHQSCPTPLRQPWCRTRRHQSAHPRQPHRCHSSTRRIPTSWLRRAVQPRPQNCNSAPNSGFWASRTTIRLRMAVPGRVVTVLLTLWEGDLLDGQGARRIFLANRAQH